MTTAAHELAVSRLVGGRTDLRRYKFRKSVMAAVEMSGVLENDSDRFWVKDGLGMVPDAYSIDPERWLVSVWEVEKSYRISDSKAQRICSCFWGLEYFEWDLAAFVLDYRSGASFRIDPLALHISLQRFGNVKDIHDWSEIVFQEEPSCSGS